MAKMYLFMISTNLLLLTRDPHPVRRVGNLCSDSSKQRSRTTLSSLIFYNTLTHKTVSMITSFYCLHSTLNHPIVSTSGWHRSIWHRSIWLRSIWLRSNYHPMRGPDFEMALISQMIYKLIGYTKS
eukprot:sb/3475546/